MTLFTGILYSIEDMNPAMKLRNEMQNGESQLKFLLRSYPMGDGLPFSAKVNLWNNTRIKVLDR